MKKLGRIKFVQYYKQSCCTTDHEHIVPRIRKVMYIIVIKHLILFISSGKERQFNQGTAQGDLVAMGMYAIRVFPLIHWNKTSNVINGRTKRLAFADDLTGAGKLQELRSWVDSIVSHGPNIGYYSKAYKSWLILKAQYSGEAIKIFEGTGATITVKGKRHLCVIFGRKGYK